MRPTLLAKLPELGTLDRKGIAALAGLVPLANDSGKQRGKRVIWGRRAEVRRVLLPTRVPPRSPARGFNRSQLA